MGWRASPNNLNLNRDYLKADSSRRAVSGVLHEMAARLLIDDHVTDGADYQYDVTYSMTSVRRGPALAAWQPMSCGRNRRSVTDSGP